MYVELWEVGNEVFVNFDLKWYQNFLCVPSCLQWPHLGGGGEIALLSVTSLAIVSKKN